MRLVDKIAQLIPGMVETKNTRIYLTEDERRKIAKAIVIGLTTNTEEETN